jgi:hypothetical protein
MIQKQKRQPREAGAVLLGGEQQNLTETRCELQPLDALARYRALHLIQRFSLQPEAAAALALLVFGGGR